MQGALKITYMDGTEEFYEVDAVGDRTDFVDRLKTFLASPTITLITESEVLIVPSTSIRRIAVTRGGALPLAELEEMPGVIVGAKRVVG